MRENMKTKSVLLAVLVSASVMAFANEPGNFKVGVVNQKESGVFKLFYEGEAKGTVKLNIRDNTGAVVYHETIKNIANFMRPLNFSGMTYGDYTIEVVDNSGKKTQAVNYSPKTPSLGNVRVTKTEEPGKYLFSLANAGYDEVNIKIYDETSALVHSQTVTVNGNLGLVYNLQKFSGEPTFTVTDKTGTVKVIK